MVIRVRLFLIEISPSKYRRTDHQSSIRGDHVCPPKVRPNPGHHTRGLMSRNQNSVKSSFPVSAAYNSTRYPYPQSTREWGFGLQYEWNGTCDWTNFLSIGAAIQWRKDIGGEERIMQYCHSLAVEYVHFSRYTTER